MSFKVFVCLFVSLFVRSFIHSFVFFKWLAVPSDGSGFASTIQFGTVAFRLGCSIKHAYIVSSYPHYFFHDLVNIVFYYIVHVELCTVLAYASIGH